jgi:hypothetical protein
MGSTTANNAEFQAAGKPIAQPVYLVDASGNPLTSTNGGATNIAQFGGVATQMATGDGIATGNAPEFAIGLYNSSGVSLDRMRDGGSIGDGVTIGFPAAGLMLFNGGSWDRWRTPQVFIPIAAVAVTAGTAASIWTPGAGKKFHLMGFMVSLSVAGYIIFKDNTTEIFRTAAMPAGDGRSNPANFGNGYTSVTANNALKMDVSASGTINGFLMGTEEF